MGCGASSSGAKYEAGKKTRITATEGGGRACTVFTKHAKLRDHYDLHEASTKDTLGTGSYGSVYKCSHKTTGRQAAVKVIKKEKVKDHAAFELEVELQKTFDHPNICRVYDAYEDTKFYSIVMELCNGGDLFDRIIEYGNFSEKQAAGLVKQMVLGVNHMHSHHVCHRDIKPENFLLSEKTDIEKSIIKMVDFGMSKRYTPGQPMSTKVCTVYYVAPEVLKGEYDELCDVWSIGVTLFILLVGSPPFASDAGDNATLKLVRKGQYSFDAQEWSYVSNDAKEMITYMLQMDRKKRYTPEQLLNHTWLKNNAPNSSKVMDSKAFDNLRQFRGYNKLKKNALAMLSKYVDDSFVKDLKEVFQSMDANNDGQLTMDEITKGVEKAGLDKVAGADFFSLLESIDFDNSGQVDYSEFLAATMDKRALRKDAAMWEVFKQMDVNDSGVLTTDNLAFILSGGEVDSVNDANQKVKDEVDLIMNTVDTNQNGEIDFEEFTQMMEGANDEIRKAFQ